MQYEQISKSERINLPKPSIDTGMGLERMTALLDGSNDNYSTDLFQPIINESTKLCGNESSIQNPSHRVIADHLKSSSFLIADGVMPSNEGRGYVLRRIMRRGMRHAHMLGCEEEIFYKIAPLVIKEESKAFNELKMAESLIIETLKNEEIRFKETIDKGLKILNDEIKKTKKKLSGETAFILYDTYGFPLDLTQDILKEKGISVDLNNFEKKMQEQRKKARLAWKGSGDTNTDKLWYKVFDNFGPTEFVGYDKLQTQGSIIQLVKDDKSVNEISQSDKAIIVLNQTSFYGESGGQIGDKGIIETKNNKFKVFDTKKILKIHLHYGEVIKGKFKNNETVNLIVNKNTRNKIKAYHSATHLLHSSLREVLGKHVAQKGSLVSADRLRFDFSHPSSLNDDEIIKVEKIVNKIIDQNDKINISVMSHKDAIKKGAIALFGEKYDDEVRVVSMGKKNNTLIFSMELCGGTHVNKTGEIKNFKIIKQSSVASGIKRIEALSQNDLLNYKKTIKEEKLLLEKNKENKSINEKQINKEKNLTLNDPSKNIIKEGVENSIKFYLRTIIDLPPNDLPQLLDEIKNEVNSEIIVLFGVHSNNISILVGVNNDYVSKVNAVDLSTKISNFLGGKGGGGRPDFARAGGGSDTKKLSDAYKFIENIIKKL